MRQPPEEAYLNCIRCGVCLGACPTYRESLTETASPRGRVALTRKGLEGDLALSDNLIEQMYSCFACMACNEVCPVGIRPADLALSMRHVQEELRPAKWKGLLFGGVVPHAGRMEAATLPLRLYQRLGVRRLVYVLGLTGCCRGSCATWRRCFPTCRSARCAASCRRSPRLERARLATGSASSSAARRACSLRTKAQRHCGCWRATAAR